MEANVLHQPRVAFDAARVLVDVSIARDEGLYEWYGDQLTAVLGPSYLHKLRTTRSELIRSERDDVRSAEAGKWRVRFEDELRTRTGVAESLQHLTLATSRRLARTN
jgi:hypothetical protein